MNLDAALPGPGGYVVPDTVAQSAQTPVPRLAEPEPAAAKAPRYEALTGIRGVLAIWVVLCHISVGLTVSGTPVGDLFGAGWTHLMDAADIAVYGFFMLSGFLMAHLYSDRFQDSPQRLRTSFGFWGLRLAKIYPLHAIVLMGYLMVSQMGLHFQVETLGHPLHPIVGDRFGSGPLVEHLFLVSAWHWQPLGHFNPVAWSISAEWFAYLCFPLAILATTRVKSAAWSITLALGCAALGVSALSSLSLLSTDPGYQHNDYGLVGLVFMFPAGMLIDRFVRSQGDGFPWNRLTVGAALVCIALLPTRYCYWSIPVFLLLIASLSRSRGLITAILASRPMVWLGEVSFSMYMVHVFVFECIGLVWAAPPPQTALETIGAMIGMVTIAIVSAAVAYYGIERPVHRRLRRPLDRLLKRV